jgi:dTDP-4-amino-4,6-dideoxygalactose transaminase
MNPYKVVAEFEKMIADYCGSGYAVAVESCSAALFLCCEMMGVDTVWIPKHTYPSVPNAIIHAGGEVKFHNRKWEGEYELEPYGIYDSALMFKKGMYHGGLQCLSFHTKKHLPIGRGGMILMDNPLSAKWLKRARFDGRDEIPLSEDKLTQLGWNMYMQPEQAVRGIEIFNVIKDRRLPELKVEDQGYPDLSKFPIYK